MAKKQKNQRGRRHITKGQDTEPSEIQAGPSGARDSESEVPEIEPVVERRNKLFLFSTSIGQCSMPACLKPDSCPSCNRPGGPCKPCHRRPGSLYPVCRTIYR